MAPLFYLVNTVLTICIYVIILRLWMQYIRVNYYHPCTQFIVKLTQPIIGPLRKIIPSIARIDTATFLVLYLFSLAKLIFILSYAINAPYFHWLYLLYTFYVILHAVGHLIFWLLLIRAILSWISRGQSLIEEFLYQLTEPFIAPVRRFVPPIGNIDLSFMIFMFILIFLNMIAMNLFNPWWGILSL